MAKASEIVENGQPGSSTTVLRAISVLEALATAPESGMGVTELSRTVGANRSTIYRILGALMPLGYVREGATAGTFRLGFRVVELGESILEQLDIRKIAGPYLRQLCTETQQTCHLSILEGTEMVYVDKVEPDEQSIPPRHRSRQTRSTPLHRDGEGLPGRARPGQVDRAGRPTHPHPAHRHHDHRSSRPRGGAGADRRTRLVHRPRRERELGVLRRRRDPRPRRRTGRRDQHLRARRGDSPPARSRISSVRPCGKSPNRSALGLVTLPSSPRSRPEPRLPYACFSSSGSDLSDS